MFKAKENEDKLIHCKAYIFGLILLCVSLLMLLIYTQGDLNETESQLTNCKEEKQLCEELNIEFSNGCNDNEPLF